MKLDQSFEVAAPVERVWQALIDVERVAPNLPGATITGKNDDGSYSGSFTVKIGPTTAAYTGKLQMESIDEAARSATMSAQGTDKRGQGGASATITSRVEPAADGRARVIVDTDYHITGRLARFGRGGMIEDISQRLLTEFAQRLAASLEGDGREAAADEAGGEDAAAAGASGVPEPNDAAEATASPVEAPQANDAAEATAPPGEDPQASDAIEAAAQVQDKPPDPDPAPPPPAAERPPAAEPPPPPPAAPPPPPPPANEPLDAGSLVGSMLAERIRANPWPLIAVVFVVWRLLRRRR